MTRTITTPAGLDALPIKSVVLDAHGRAFQKFTFGWEATGLTGAHDRVATPATVLHDPSTPTVPARQVEPMCAKCGVKESEHRSGYAASRCTFFPPVPAPDPDDRQALVEAAFERVCRDEPMSGVTRYDVSEWLDLFTEAGFRRLTVTPEMVDTGRQALHDFYAAGGNVGNGLAARAVLEAALGDTK